MSLKPGEIEIGARGLFIAGAVFSAWVATLIALLQVDLSWGALLMGAVGRGPALIFKCWPLHYSPRCHARDALP